jgi:hypothetical protein
MKAMYERSTLGWSDPDKTEEMKLPDMRFLVLYAEEKEQGEGSGLGELVGFTSFMVTEEGGEQVVYWLPPRRPLSPRPTNGRLVGMA